MSAHPASAIGKRRKRVAKNLKNVVYHGRSTSSAAGFLRVPALKSPWNLGLPIWFPRGADCGGSEHMRGAQCSTRHGSSHRVLALPRESTAPGPQRSSAVQGEERVGSAPTWHEMIEEHSLNIRQYSLHHSSSMFILLSCSSGPTRAKFLVIS